jgi:hypothetical protein
LSRACTRVTGKLYLQGYGEARAISLTGDGSLFTVSSGAALIFGENITLQGKDGNNAPLVVVESGGTLAVNSGARITGNTHTNTAGNAIGGGVRVRNGESCILNGGKISGNSATSSAGKGCGGGVHVEGNNSIFKKTPATGSSTSGTIYGSGEGADSNKVINSAGNEIAGRGRAVNALGRNPIDATVDSSRHLDSTDGTGF